MYSASALEPYLDPIFTRIPREDRNPETNYDEDTGSVSRPRRRAVREAMSNTQIRAGNPSKS